ncbi:MAG: hypothetical protein IT376_23375 [Polyangiaceae bacterium]|nr:hypothetical protein [Polyangiaceae bacterium]
MAEGRAIVDELRRRAQLETIAQKARKLREHLAPLVAAHGDRAHFRPTVMGVDLVSVTPERPMVVRPAIKNLAAFVPRFEEELARYCLETPAPRRSVEKELQARLIREARGTGGRLASLEAASAAAGRPRELVFVTDGVVVPWDGARLASDLLALDRGTGQAAVIEVSRSREERAGRVAAFATAVERHLPEFGALFAALLGAPVTLAPSCQRWLLWPAGEVTPDPGAAGLAARGIWLVTYSPDDPVGSALRVATPQAVSRDP